MLCLSWLLSSLSDPESTSPFTGAVSEWAAAVCHTNPEQDHSSSVFVHVITCVMQAWCTGLQLYPQTFSSVQVWSPLWPFTKGLDVVRHGCSLMHTTLSFLGTLYNKENTTECCFCTSVSLALNNTSLTATPPALSMQAMLPLASTLHSMLFSSVFCGEWKIPGLFQALGMAFITQLLSDLFMFKKKKNV